jgi:hypothetical protein
MDAIADQLAKFAKRSNQSGGALAEAANAEAAVARAAEKKSGDEADDPVGRGGSSAPAGPVEGVPATAARPAPQPARNPAKRIPQPKPAPHSEVLQAAASRAADVAAAAAGTQSFSGPPRGAHGTLQGPLQHPRSRWLRQQMPAAATFAAVVQAADWAGNSNQCF